MRKGGRPFVRNDRPDSPPPDCLTGQGNKRNLQIFTTYSCNVILSMFSMSMEGNLTQGNSTKVLGIAEYTATWVQRSSLVRLTATGLLPCSNYCAQLELRPERVTPPMWDMVFYVQDLCLEAIAPFDLEVVMVNASGAKTISVRDACGEHEIPITDPLVESTSLPLAAVDRDLYKVCARVPRPEKGHHGCMIFPADSMVTAIY